MAKLPDHRGRRSRDQPEPTEQELARSTRIRAADARFVLDELIDLAHGGNPDAEHRALRAAGLDRR